MADKRKVIYYSDELTEEFSTAVIEARPIDESYDYGGRGFFWTVKHLFWYRIVATPLALLYLRLFWHHKIVNRRLLAPYKRSAIFLFGNHTNAYADALIPTFVSWPHHTFVVVHANNVSMPYLGRITPYLGALPLPDNLAAGRHFMDAMTLHVSRGESIMIYPEAHIWPFYTKIRPFGDAAFKYPVQYKTPVFCFTNVYRSRRFSKRPQLVTYVDGPFFADEGLSAKEQRRALRDAVYAKMTERSALNTAELITYIRKDGGEEQK